MANATPATLGSLTATCDICGLEQKVRATGSEIKKIDDEICLVVHMDSADLELHMMEHNLCACVWTPDGESTQRVQSPMCTVHVA